MSPSEGTSCGSTVVDRAGHQFTCGLEDGHKSPSHKWEGLGAKEVRGEMVTQRNLEVTWTISMRQL